MCFIISCQVIFSTQIILFLFAEIVMNSDGANVATLYRSVEELVARKQFDMQMTLEDVGLVVSFHE